MHTTTQLLTNVFTLLVFPAAATRTWVSPSRGTSFPLPVLCLSGVEAAPTNSPSPRSTRRDAAPTEGGVRGRECTRFPLLLSSFFFAYKWKKEGKGRGKSVNLSLILLVLSERKMRGECSFPLLFPFYFFLTRFKVTKREGKEEEKAWMSPILLVPSEEELLSFIFLSLHFLLS